MKRVIMSLGVLGVVFILCTSAQAAIFSFEDMTATPVPTTFTLERADMDATFDNFTWVDTQGNLVDYWMPSQDSATITFNKPTVLESITGWYSNLSISFWLNGSKVDEFTDGFYFAGSMNDFGGLMVDSLIASGTLGITEIVTSPAPLPGAAILLGSGLIGLLGLRRRYDNN